MRKMMLLAAMVAVAALMMAAAPAFADDNEHPGGGPCSGGSNRDEPCGNEVPGCKNEGAAEHNPHCIPEENNGNDHNGNDHNNNNNNNNNNNRDFCDRFDCNFFFVPNFVPNFVPEITQENEQEVESGDATQNINVTGGGANSNQCAGVQGVTNTGNATNNTGVLQAGGFDGNNNNGFFDNRRFDNRFFDNHRFDNRFFDNGFFNDGNGFNNGGDVEVNDVGNFTISPSNSTSCTQQVNQAASATG